MADLKCVVENCSYNKDCLCSKGDIMVEQVFNWPGFSKYGANAMITKDLNSVCAVVLVIGATFLVVNLIVDVINAMVDPRIRLGGDL